MDDRVEIPDGEIPCSRLHKLVENALKFGSVAEHSMVGVVVHDIYLLLSPSVRMVTELRDKLNFNYGRNMSAVEF